MRPKLPDYIKKEVIRFWLLGLSRDNIASALNISGGTVTNIIGEWKLSLDVADADALRELGKAIHTSGLSPAEYAAGVRVTSILAKNGVNSDKAEQFLSTTFKKCERTGITPNTIISHIEDLTGYSDEIKLPEINLHIKQKIREKEELDKQILVQEENASNLKSEVEEIEERRDRIAKEQRKEGADFRLFVEAQQELERHNVPVSDVPKFAIAVKTLAQCGYRTDLILAKTKEMIDFYQKREWLKVAIYEAEKKNNKLNEQNSALQQQINVHSDKLPIYRSLENCGVDHRALLTLLEIILSISNSNGISYMLAVNKFFADIETQYNAKLGFESEIEDLKLDIEILSGVKGNLLEDIKNSPSTYWIVT
jgi:hypothetical protein